MDRIVPDNGGSVLSQNLTCDQRQSVWELCLVGVSGGVTCKVPLENQTSLPPKTVATSASCRSVTFDITPTLPSPSESSPTRTKGWVRWPVGTGKSASVRKLRG